MTAADFDTISVPRPAPGDVLLVITDADGASTWTSCPKAYLADGDLMQQLVQHLEDGQRLVHEQRQAATT